VERNSNPKPPADPKSPENQPSSQTNGQVTNVNPISGPARVRPYMEYQSTLQLEPSPQERRLALLYERELRAIASPTGIQAARGGTGQNPLENPSLAPNGGEGSQLAALAQILSSRNAPDMHATQTTIGAGIDDQNLQARKEAFLAKYRVAASDDYLKSVRTPALSQYEIKAGWEIPAVLEQAINSDLRGDLKALVTANVYDTATGRYLLIPQGSRLLGTYDSAIAYGQDGLQVVWNRIVFPDASSIDLGGMVGQDARGASGLRYDVDNHYKRLIGFSVLSSTFSAGFQLSQSRRDSILQNPSAAEVAASSVGQSVTQVGTEITHKNLNVQPTIKIPVGYKFNVRVSRDILFESPYEPR
jgi:type IV secretion system protein TrbI